MRQLSLACTLIFFLVSACGTQPSAPMVAISTQTESITAKPTAAATATPASTATEAATATPEDTATPEITQYGWPGSPEQFRDVVIPSDDLLNGKYQEWLQTQSKLFDPTKIRTDVQLLFNPDGEIAYLADKVPNFTGKYAGMEPFRRYMSGITTYQWLDYIVMPIEYFDPEHPDKNEWVVTVAASGIKPKKRRS